MKVLVFCASGFETMEFSVFIDVMGWAKVDFGYPVETVTCGLTPVVTSAFGVRVTVDRLLDEVDVGDYAALAIPGGFAEYGFYEEAYDARFSELIRAFHQQGKPVASVCVGALALGKSGILHGRKATTYHLNDGRRQKQLAEFGVDVVNERVVVDGNIITSYCPETAADVAFTLLGMLCGQERMRVVRTAMGYR